MHTQVGLDAFISPPGYAFSGVRSFTAGLLGAEGLLNSEELNLWVDEVSSCLGLLINLTEHGKEGRVRLRNLRLPRPSSNEAIGPVELLSRLMAVIAAAPQ